ncbi:DUF2759 domain-containing protein [Bacillus methanolicus]|uniref:Putative membrane protein n=1 Tax=Bacillus methanolicus (strain MGA3 / ATCC 53907) TaxID=796606 RepID=I3EAG4_BACMM|nr:DUF2759 domain-containing protein [Bacillus methanolicus]AIE60725.1 putative membrane protein [Bacillus methanolicus MGA3]EIJ83485.1 membrane protein [Bacillus methanolicus MGA3]UQD52736.1 DUF2759 domain-containing protein [Bacillus methanolicus]
MGLVIIFGLVALLAAYGTYSTIRNKNFLGLIFAAGTFAVIGWFTIMTAIHHGIPASH